jgi:hypothetical protein
LVQRGAFNFDTGKRMSYRQVKSRLDLAVRDLGATQLKNIAEPVRVYALEVGRRAKSTKSTIVREGWALAFTRYSKAYDLARAGAWGTYVRP